MIVICENAPTKLVIAAEEANRIHVTNPLKSSAHAPLVLTTTCVKRAEFRVREPFILRRPQAHNHARLQRVLEKKQAKALQPTPSTGLSR
jgi:hypothetical protein